MQKTKIEWTEYTWNPLVGCKNDCWYCYSKKIRNRFNPDIPFDKIICYNNRLLDPLKLKKSSKIFVCSMADLFGDWVEESIIWNIINIIKACPQHIFQFLTKNPGRYVSFNFPKNCWFGTTITCRNDLWRMETIRNLNGFVSIEPMLEDIGDFSFNRVQWVIIGALTGYGGKYQPKKEWIENILTQVHKHKIPIFMKNNLISIMGKNLIQEYPKEGLK